MPTSRSGWHTEGRAVLSGGSGEIRTHGAFLLDSFQDCCNKPDSATLPNWWDAVLRPVPVSRSLPPVTSLSCTITCPRIYAVPGDSYWRMRLRRCFGAGSGNRTRNLSLARICVTTSTMPAYATIYSNT